MSRLQLCMQILALVSLMVFINVGKAFAFLKLNRLYDALQTNKSLLALIDGVVLLRPLHQEKA